jgi:hypothetical protein
MLFFLHHKFYILTIRCWLLLRHRQRRQRCIKQSSIHQPDRYGTCSHLGHPGKPDFCQSDGRNDECGKNSHSEKQSAGNTYQPCSLLHGCKRGGLPAIRDNCTSSLASGSSCSVSIEFKPSATGVRTVTLNVNNSAKTSPQSVSLSGTGK